MPESPLLPRNLLVFGKRTATQTQVQSDTGPIFIQHDLLPALDLDFLPNLDTVLSLRAEAPSMLFNSGKFKGHHAVHGVDRSLIAKLYAILFSLLSSGEKF